LSQEKTRSIPIDFPPLAVIADDLTGSCDTAAQFSRYGITVAVTSHSGLEQDLPVNLVVVNTASRGLSKEKAREIVYRSALRLLQQGRRPFYKKIDSTLKGQWCAEIFSVMSLTQPDMVIVAPAFPTWGRTIQNGILHLDGQRVVVKSITNSQLPGDDSTDVANLLGCLRAEFGSQVELMSREVICHTPLEIEKCIQSARRKGCRVLLFDSESEDDLRKIVLAGSRLDETVLWVGSAGLARFLPARWGYSLVGNRPETLEIKGPILLVCGSLNPTNKQQLQLLNQQGLAKVITVEDEDVSLKSSREKKLTLALETLSQGKAVALSLRLNKRIHSRDHLQQLQSTLQSITSGLLDNRYVGALVIVGGETALKVLERNEARGIRILGEVEVGVPYGRLIGGRLDDLALVTKAGGFGNTRTLCGIFQFFQGVLH